MRKSYKANSLVVTLVISLILAVICSSAILLSYYNRNIQIRNDIENRLQNNLKSSINLVLADTEIHIQPKNENLDLFDEGKDSVELHKQLWGTFQLASINTFYKRFFKKASFLYASSMPSYMNACLYVADHRRPIGLVGQTKLIGNAYLPQAGIKASYINQQSFEGDKLLTGKILESSDSLPALNSKILENIYSFLQTEIRPATQLLRDTMNQSFTDSSIFVYSSGKILLTKCSITGHILLKSDVQIEVDSSAKLNDVILVAPSIVFRQGFHGRLQAFASDSLVVERKGSFDYPSLLMLVKTNNSKLQNKLVIEEDCRINGNIISYCINDDLYKSWIEVGSGTKVNGIIYTRGYFSLKGNIAGIAMTDFFILKTPTTIYENYLMNVTINREELSNYFLAAAIFNSLGSQQILQWVN